MSKKTKGELKTPPSVPEQFCTYSCFFEKKNITLSLKKLLELYTEAQKSKKQLKITLAISISDNELFILDCILKKEKRN